MKRALGVFGFLGCLLALTAGAFVVHRFYWVDPQWWKILGTVDKYAYHGPIQFYRDHWIQQGQFPLWNPLILLGTPAVGDFQAGVFYPFAMLRSLLTVDPTPMKTLLALTWMGLFHLLVMGLGTYCLARRNRFGFSSAFLAAFIVAFAPVLTRRLIDQPNVAGVVAWLPWLLLLLEVAQDAPGWRRRIAAVTGAGLVFGVSVLAGYPDHSVYITLVMSAYLVLRRLFALDETAKRPHGMVRGLAADVLAIVVILALAVAVALPALVPAAQLAGHSERLRGSSEEVFPLEELAEPSEQRYLSVSAYRDVRHLLQSQILFFGPRMAIQEMRGAGLLVLLLSLVALLYWRDRRVAVYGLLFLVLLDCSIGPPMPLATLLRWLCPHQLGWPFRANQLMPLPLAMLAATGLEGLAKRPIDRKRARRATVLLGAAAIGSLLVLGHWFVRYNLFGWAPPALYAVTGVAAAVLVAGLWAGPGWLYRAIIPLLFLTEAALWTPAGYNWFFSGPNPLREQVDALCEAPEPYTGNGRIADPNPNSAAYALKPAMNGYLPLHLARVFDALSGLGKENVYQRMLLPWDSTARQHRGNLLFKRRFWLAREYAVGPLPPKDAVFPVATTLFLPNDPGLSLPKVEAVPWRAISDDAWSLEVAGDEGGYMPHVGEPGKKVGIFFARLPRPVATSRYVPGLDPPVLHAAVELRCRTTGRGRVQVYFEDLETGDQLLGRGFAFGPLPEERVAVVPLPDLLKSSLFLHVEFETPGFIQVREAKLLVDMADEHPRIEVLSEGPNHIEVALHELPGHRCLSYVDAYYPGWKAWLDGEATTILESYGLFKGVAVPPGNHVVRFEFEPVGLLLALRISLIVLLGACVLLALLAVDGLRSLPKGQGGLRNPVP